jgi:hypothetical protein
MWVASPTVARIDSPVNSNASAAPIRHMARRLK